MQKFKQALSRFIDSKRIIDNPLLCYAYGTDASLYRLTPKLVVQVENQHEVLHLIHLANRYKISITFRAAGTSLSGQALSDQVLVVLANTAWQKYSISNNGRQISLEPGIIGAHANLFLKPYKTKIGPDPASINVCKIGGIAANNSSGMCCGISKNSYQTMHSMQFMLANGAAVDTANQESKEQFCRDNQNIIQGITAIRDQILGDDKLSSLIRHKFKIKNTSGYSLNAFIDFTDPVDILSHLMIGSEGTLGFISEISYNCVLDNQFKAVSLIYCEDLNNLIKLALKLSDLDIDAMELLDITSLNSIKNIIVAQAYLPLLGTNTAAMLIEVSALNPLLLENKIALVQEVIDNCVIRSQISFTADEKIYHDLWAIRKGMLPTIGSNRPTGSTVVIEDIAVKITQLPDLINDLHQLFIRYNYTNAAIFGHILAGNIHFVFTPCFDSKEGIQQYKGFMDDMCKLVAIKYSGSLKAEHGCGRNIAPFVELEWGSLAYSIMWQIKNLLDPHHILNPDVKLTRNQNLHLENLKELNMVAPEIDKCIECGFCEVVCPSKNLTLTPRQRISTYRKMQTLKTSNPKLYKKFSRDYKYYAVDTCATTGLCKINCPVGIDTGQFILTLKDTPGLLPVRYWQNHFSAFVKLNKYALGIANLVANFMGRKHTYKLSRTIKKIIPILPLYLPTLPEAQSAKFRAPPDYSNPSLALTHASNKVLYFPTCNNRIFSDATLPGQSNNALERLIQAMGYTICYPDNLAELCCGQVFSSRGNKDSANFKADQLAAILAAIDYPIITDNSSCLYTILQHGNTQIMDSVGFIHNNLDKLSLNKKYQKLALFIDCSSHKIGHEAKIREILSQCSHEIITPLNISCCGFAGDKGLTVPQLNQSALSGLKDQIADCEIGVTFNRNCQIGLSFYGARTYLSLPEIVLNCLSG